MTSFRVVKKATPAVRGIIKSNIVPLEDTTLSFINLRPVRYDITPNTGVTYSDIGLIPEEVADYFPSLVGDNEEIAYDKLVVVCIQQIKLLKGELSILKDKFEDPEPRIG